ncbi:MAG TPA: SPOR domain-containing protein [Deltaproteobacteria bacterium]|nr:SPOR domain-containing protein [Deltaproteobacteria bacterium]
MARKRTHKKQSLTKNIAMLFLSLGILAGASLLFSTINARPEFSYDPFGERWKSLVASDPIRNEKPSGKAQASKSAASGFEYSYWDILLLQDSDSASAADSFSIQIAAFRSPETARSFAAELEEKTRIRCTVADTGKWTVVRWGSFQSRETAERYCSKLSDRLQRECIVVKM